MILIFNYNIDKEDDYENTCKLLFILMIGLILVACSQGSHKSKEQNKDTVTIKNTYEFKDKTIPTLKEIRKLRQSRYLKMLKMSQLWTTVL